MKRSITYIITFVIGIFFIQTYNIITLFIETLTLDVNKKILKTNAEIENFQRLLEIQQAEMWGEDVVEDDED